jgi:hypothetical protein
VATINGTGNDLANVLTGNGAVDILTGAGGNDRLDCKVGLTAWRADWWG